MAVQEAFRVSITLISSSKDANMKPEEQRSFLLAAAAWQDSLLQSYRALHVTIQGFVIAAGAAVLAVQLAGVVQTPQPSALSSDSLWFNFGFTVLLGLLFWIQLSASRKFRGVVENRARDVDEWHRQLMLLENGIAPEYRIFTHFKRWQQLRRKGAEHIAPDKGEPITPAEIDTLLGKGADHTRSAVDASLFRRLHGVWAIMVFASLCISGWFAIAVDRT